MSVRYLNPEREHGRIRIVGGGSENCKLNRDGDCNNGASMKDFFYKHIKLPAKLSGTKGNGDTKDTSSKKYKKSEDAVLSLNMRGKRHRLFVYSRLPMRTQSPQLLLAY